MTARQTALINGRIVLPHDIVEGRALLIADDKIIEVAEMDALGNDVSAIDVGGRIIAPGLIDIHIHGANGAAFNQATDDAFTAITAETARRGITSLLATTVTAPIPELMDTLDCIQRWVDSPRVGTQILGAHVEGPYFSLPQAGAQDPANIRNPNDGTVDHLLEFADVIHMMTFAPELPGALELTRKLVKLDILPAAGHSSATEDEIVPAIELGLRHMIHIWSGQSTTVREGPWRKPGLLEVTLAYDNLTAEMITDNRHLPPTLMKLAYKCLGPDRLCAISDATSGAGLPDGARYFMGELAYEVHDGVGMVPDRTSFAGSTTLLNAMIPILTDVVGVPLTEALRMASLTPARVIGVADQKGSLEAGKDADVAIFEDDFRAWRVMIGGQWLS